MARVLVVDDEAQFRDLISQVLTSDGHTVETAADVRVALETMPKFEPDLVLSDIRMPGTDGMAFLKQVKQKSPDIDVVLMTAYGSKDTAVEALRLGARDYIEKPFDNTELKKRIRNITDRKKLEDENRQLKSELDRQWHIDNMIGQSAAIQEISKLIRQVAPKNASVLIRGPSGTGKELAAKAIHALSIQKDGPFVAINCGAMPETLLESELFGYEKGAFTGADRQKPGKFEVAAGGTLFLDEIGDVSLNMQVKLLRVLQERQFTRVGGHENIGCSARIVAATNRNLEDMIKDGQFREDLYYRLNVFPVFVPSLKERREDVPLLVEHFLHKFAFERDALEPAAMKLLMDYQWPGNIRELENTIERATILSTSGKITVVDLPLHVKSMLPSPTGGVLNIDIPDEGISLEAVERHLVYKAIEKAGGNKSKAAQLLGITRRTLYSRLEMYERGESRKPEE